MKIPVSFLHTSPAAIGPLMQYYSEQAPDLEITNQLDDGLLRLLAAGRVDVVEARLRRAARHGDVLLRHAGHHRGADAGRRDPAVQN
jgi:hypothetical protein